MDPRAGYTTPNMLEADINRALVAAGRRLVVVADHTKWATVGMSTILDLEGADVVVTDHLLPAEAVATLREAVAEVIVAGGGHDPVPGPPEARRTHGPVELRA
jgi:DeoR/GlpR family transcriptional regulator of sugar metabolism